MVTSLINENALSVEPSLLLTTPVWALMHVGTITLTSSK